MMTSTASITSITNTAARCHMIGLAEVCDLTSLSKSSVYRAMAENRFPKSLRLGPRRIAWRLSDIGEWLDQQAEVAA